MDDIQRIGNVRWNPFCMNFIKKNLSNILLVLFALFLFTPYGLPVRATLIKGVSFVTTWVFDMKIEEENRVGLDSYNWNLISDQGEMLDFQKLKGEVILINYWATWCPPCVAEMSGMQALYDDYKNKAVFLFVTNDDKYRVESFMKKNDYSFPVYYQASAKPLGN